MMERFCLGKSDKMWLQASISIKMRRILFL